MKKVLSQLELSIDNLKDISKYMKEKKTGLIEGISLENFIDHYTDMIDSEVNFLQNSEVYRSLSNQEQCPQTSSSQHHYLCQTEDYHIGKSLLTKRHHFLSCI